MLAYSNLGKVQSGTAKHANKGVPPPNPLSFFTSRKRRVYIYIIYIIYINVYIIIHIYIFVCIYTFIYSGWSRMKQS